MVILMKRKLQKRKRKRRKKVNIEVFNDVLINTMRF